ncbi:MAG: hypothetical protein COB02_02485 [Candidatus Cloacimonadota bacterium]|nr:MAG: hypothetical protein COB02_02485 [Candidatus Cloacimonadota bacterium]
MEINWLDTILKFLGGLGFFFFGMKQLSDSLQSMSGNLIKKVLHSITTNRLLGVSVGVLITCLVQSSSVVTVMTVSFVNAGFMNLNQAIAVIFGANIGTTITGWIIAIKIGKYGIHMIGIGAIPMMFTKNVTLKRIGALFFALGLIFFGLETMSGAFKPLRTDPTFISYLTYFTADTFLSLIATVGMGCLLTIMVQSSSAMLGITIALASTGTITFQTAAALVLGENIGTTITAILAAVGTNTNARRAAYAHAIFNISAVCTIVILFRPYISLVDKLIAGNPDFLAPDGSKPNIATHIAAVHTVFNVSATLIFLPFLQYLAQFVCKLVPRPDHEEQNRLELVGNPSQLSPVIAIEQCYAELIRMGDITGRLIDYTEEYVIRDVRNTELKDKVYKYEDITDNIQKEILLFLIKVMEKKLSHQQTLQINAMISISDDMESIGDYCQNLVRYRKRLFDDNHALKEETKQELKEFFQLVKSAYATILEEVKNPESVDLQRFDRIIAHLKEKAEEIKVHHLNRVKTGDYSPLTNLTFTDMIVALRKINGHIAGINKAIDSFKD